MVVVSIETIILFNDYFSKDKNNLKESIKGYYSYIKSLNKKIVIRSMDDLINKFPSFDSYIVKKVGLSMPSTIKSELKSILR
jgi:hypothetical protein